MEVVGRYWHRWVVAPFMRAATAIADALEESSFRCALAWDVLLGRIPKEVPKRPWNRNREAPVLVDIYSWTDERLIASILVWPPLESPAHDAPYIHDKRAQRIKESFEKVCGDSPGRPTSRPTTAYSGALPGSVGRPQTVTSSTGAAFGQGAG